MNKERLSEILYISFCDFKNRNPYNTISNEEIDEAHKKLEELIELDTPKYPVIELFEWKEGDGYYLPFCPNCKRLLSNGASICDCGQRLKWGE